MEKLEPTLGPGILAILGFERQLLKSVALDKLLELRSPRLSEVRALSCKISNWLLNA